MNISKVLVCGSRTWTNYERIHADLATLMMAFHPELTIIHGDAKYGADALCDRACAELNLNVIRFPANWGKYGKRAGFLRNVEMLEQEPDLVQAYRATGESRGTDMMIKLAVQAGIRTVVRHADDELVIFGGQPRPATEQLI